MWINYIIWGQNDADERQNDEIEKILREQKRPIGSIGKSRKYTYQPQSRISSAHKYNNYNYIHCS